MSSENVELVQRLLDAIEARDLSCLIELTDPDVEWRSFFEEGEYHGHEGLRQYVRDLGETLDVISPRVASLLHVGNLVVGVGTVRYRGRESGAESESPAGWLFEFRAGKLRLFRAFRDPEQALRVVGRKD